MLTHVFLPFPPSVNSIWRRGKNPRTGRPVVYLDKKYKAWKAEADALLLTQKPLKAVQGHFDAIITLDERRRRADADNLIKVILDFLQRAELIENDRLCDRITAFWGDTTRYGCDVSIAPAEPSIKRTLQ